MSSSQPTIDATPATIGDWRELASRAGDGLEISLFWSRSANCVKVTVLDERLGEFFDLDVAAADALSAFYHPFAYVANTRRSMRSRTPATPAALLPTPRGASGA